MHSQIPPSTHLSIIGAYKAHAHGYYGSNVTVAVLDTGIYPHSDFFYPHKKILLFRDYVHKRLLAYDDSGHGSHIAGIIASGGSDSFGQFLGIAPSCNLICVKILDGRGNGKISHVVQAIHWLVSIRKQYNIRIINISIGSSVDSPKDESSALIEAVNYAWDSGILVIAAAGNEGPERKSITTPGISRKIITAGTMDDTMYTLNGIIQKENYSGRGPTINCIKKPDIVAPGNQILSCSNSPGRYVKKSGTSMSTPMVSAAFALLLSKEPDLTNKESKLRLKESAKDLGLPWQQQGWGLLNIPALLRLDL